MTTQQYHELLSRAFPGQQYALNLYPGTEEIDPSFTPLSEGPFRDESGVPTRDPSSHRHGDLILLGDQVGEPNLLATAWLRGAGVMDMVAKGWHCIVRSTANGPASIDDADIEVALDLIQAGLERARVDLAELHKAETI